jgi:hypothetical protein
MIEDDTHDELVKAFIEYSKANEKWETKRSHRTYYAANRWLRKIRKLSRARMTHNTEYFHEKVQNQKQEGKE